MQTRSLGLCLALVGAGGACAHDELSAERAAAKRWSLTPVAPQPAATSRPADGTRLEGGLGHFVAEALRRSPRLQAAHARWRAALAGAGAAGRLPDPELSYAGFVRAVETRVGPQRHRISLRQAFPWPGRLDAGRDAATARAAAEGEVFRAEVLAVVHEVAVAFWRLWSLERTHTIRLEHEGILQGLADTVQARVETGEKSIAELLQVQLRVQSLRDHRSKHRSQRRQSTAQLLAVVGARPGVEPRLLSAPPEVRPPSVDGASLRAELQRHPLVERWRDLEATRLATARSARKDAWPRFVVGAEYIVTGAARAPGVDDDGKDPIALSFGLSLPVWRRSLAREVEAAEAEAAAARAEGYGAWLRAVAELESVLARIEETQERVVRFEQTLIPQAEALEASVRAAYEVQRAGVASVLLALEDELELRLQLAEVQAQHAVAWAELERLTGRSLEEGPS